VRIAFVVQSLTVVDYSLKTSYDITIDTMTIVARFIKWLWETSKELDVKLNTQMSFVSGSAI